MQSPTPSQKRSHTPTQTQPRKGHIHLYPAVNLWKRKLIKFIRNLKSHKYNFRKVRCQTIGISMQYRTNDKSAAVINNFRHILTKNYIPFTCHLSRFTSLYNVLFCFLPRLLLCIIFTVTCTTLWNVHSMLDDLTQKK